MRAFDVAQVNWKAWGLTDHLSYSLKAPKFSFMTSKKEGRATIKLIHEKKKSY